MWLEVKENKNMCGCDNSLFYQKGLGSDSTVIIHLQLVVSGIYCIFSGSPFLYTILQALTPVYSWISFLSYFATI